MKTIAEIAKEIGVSKQAVYKRYKGRLYTEVHTYAHTENGITYIAEQGEALIKRDFLEDGVSNGAHTERIQDIPMDMVTDTLIQMLQKELEAKNKLIEELTATIKIQAETMNADRKNELAETLIDTQQVNLRISDSKKSGFWGKFFSRK